MVRVALTMKFVEIEYRYSEVPVTLVHLLGEPFASYL
jgi:hypothetical protein